MSCKEPLEYLGKKRDVMDMMATQHFILSDTYNFKNTMLDCCELIAAVIICGMTFFNYSNVNDQYANSIWFSMGFFSIFVFAITLVKQRLDLKTKAEKHDYAGRVFSKIKIEISDKIQEWCKVEVTSEMVLEFMSGIYKQYEDLVTIPDNKFTKLKHKHYRKIELSKYIDENKNCPWFLCKIKFMFKK